MYRIITVEREFGSGAGQIARQLADRLGWKLWDHALTEEIARRSHVECAAVEKLEERVDSTFRRLAKVFWRGSYERAMPLPDEQAFDCDCFVATGKEVMKQAAAAGLGLTCLSLAAVRDAITLGKLQVLDTTLPRLVRPFYLIYHQQKQLSAGLERFIAHCRSALT